MNFKLKIICAELFYSPFYSVIFFRQKKTKKNFQFNSEDSTAQLP